METPWFFSVFRPIGMAFVTVLIFDFDGGRFLVFFVIGFPWQKMFSCSPGLFPSPY